MIDATTLLFILIGGIFGLVCICGCIVYCTCEKGYCKVKEKRREQESNRQTVELTQTVNPSQTGTPQVARREELSTISFSNQSFVEDSANSTSSFGERPPQYDEALSTLRQSKSVPELHPHYMIVEVPPSVYADLSAPNSPVVSRANQLPAPHYSIEFNYNQNE